MEENKNPNGVNNEAEVVKKAAPPPMKKAKKGETSQAVLDAAKKAVVEKNIEKAKKEEAKKKEAEKKEAESLDRAIYQELAGLDLGNMKK